MNKYVPYVFSRVVRRLYCALEFTGDLVKMQILIQKVWGGAWELAFLSSFWCCWSADHTLRVGRG